MRRRDRSRRPLRRFEQAAASLSRLRNPLKRLPSEGPVAKSLTTDDALSYLAKVRTATPPPGRRACWRGRSSCGGPDRLAEESLLAAVRLDPTLVQAPGSLLHRRDAAPPPQSTNTSKPWRGCTG